MKDILHTIIASIVDEPNEVKITEDEQNGVILFTIKVAKSDMGRVIGKEGKIIRSIRNVMKIPAMKQNKKVQVAINEDTEA